jgi:disulfide bond formation protein DsbB
MALRIDVDRGESYSLGALALFLSAAVIAAALAFQYLGGYIPCPLCLMQRYAYYAAIPLLFVALILASGGKSRWASVLFFLIALAFLANAGLAIYQAGAEWKFWPGPEFCGTMQPLTGDAGNLLKDLETTKVVRCDDASWRFLGLSFAGWNILTSLVIFAITLRATFAASSPISRLK